MSVWYQGDQTQQLNPVACMPVGPKIAKAEYIEVSIHDRSSIFTFPDSCLIQNKINIV